MPGERNVLCIGTYGEWEKGGKAPGFVGPAYGNRKRGRPRRSAGNGGKWIEFRRLDGPRSRGDFANRREAEDTP